EAPARSVPPRRAPLGEGQASPLLALRPQLEPASRRGQSDDLPGTTHAPRPRPRPPPSLRGTAGAGASSSQPVSRNASPPTLSPRRHDSNRLLALSSVC